MPPWCVPLATSSPSGEKATVHVSIAPASISPSPAPLPLLAPPFFSTEPEEEEEEATALPARSKSRMLPSSVLAAARDPFGAVATPTTAALISGSLMRRVAVRSAGDQTFTVSSADPVSKRLVMVFHAKPHTASAWAVSARFETRYTPVAAI